MSKQSLISVLIVTVILVGGFPGGALCETVTYRARVEQTTASLSRHLAAVKAEQEEVRRLRAIEQARMETVVPWPASVTPASSGSTQTVTQRSQPTQQEVAVSSLGQGSSEWIAGRNDPSQTGIQPIAGREALLVSYSVPPSDPLQFLTGRSWTYDNAAGAIGMVMNGNTAEARAVLAALQGLMNADGTLGFSYQVDSTYVDPTVRAGTLAWVGYAMAFYQRSTGDASFQASAEKIAGYLKTLQLSNGLLKGGPDVGWVSTEHNIDAYFFYRELDRVSGDSGYLATAGQIKNGILSRLWTGNNRSGHFLQGLNDSTPTLDANALGAIFLSAIGDSTRANQALKYVETTFRNTQKITGSSTSIAGYSPDSAKKTVWLEGTLQAAAAYRRVGNTRKSDGIFSEVLRLQNNWLGRGLWHGALPYAMPRYTNADGTFSDLESVASTAWLLIAQDVQGGSSLFWDRD